MGLRDFFRKLTGRYKAPEKRKGIEIHREKGSIMTSDGKDPKFDKLRTKICNQKGAFGRVKI